MDYDKLTSIQLDVLKETLNISVGGSVSKLSDYINKNINLTVPSVNIVNLKELFSSIGNPDEEIYAIFSHFIGEIEGYTLFLLKKDVYQKLLSFIDAQSDETIFFSDISNIISSSFIDSLVKFTGLNINNNYTHSTYDILGAVVEQGILEYSQISDKVIFVENSFLVDDNTLDCHSLFFPNPVHFDKFFEKLGITNGNN